MDKLSVYKNTECVSGTNCFNFVIYDSAFNGLCCQFGKVFHENIILQDSHDFMFFDIVPLFDNGCPLP